LRYPVKAELSQFLESAVICPMFIEGRLSHKHASQWKDNQSEEESEPYLVEKKR
jgi:hypothetical protein